MTEKLKPNKCTDPRKGFCEILRAAGFKTKYTFVLGEDICDALTTFPDGLDRLFSEGIESATIHTYVLAGYLTDHGYTHLSSDAHWYFAAVEAHAHGWKFEDWPKKKD